MNEKLTDKERDRLLEDAEKHLPPRPLDIREMSRADFEKIPERDWDEDIGLFDTLVIIPAPDDEELHDSGYRYIRAVACKGFEPICFVSAYSDVLHIDGIGGFGFPFPPNTFKRVESKSWSIDCLPKSGYFQLFSGYKYKLKVGVALSSLEVYAIEDQ